jgi:hypothetical protein
MCYFKKSLAKTLSRKELSNLESLIASLRLCEKFKISRYAVNVPKDIPPYLTKWIK